MATAKSRYWVDDDDDEFMRALESNIAISQQEEIERRATEAELQRDMQIAYGFRVKHAAHATPTNFPVIAELHHEFNPRKALSKSKTSSTTDQTAFLPRPSYSKNTSFPELKRRRNPETNHIEDPVDEFLSILGNELAKQIDDGLLSEDDIKPDSLKGHTMPNDKQSS